MTYNPLTEARTTVQGLIQAAIPEVSCYGAPPEVLTMPGVIVIPGEPWAAGRTWSKTEVALEVTLVASSLGDNEAAYERLEDLAWRVQVALLGSAVLGPLRSPQLQTFGTAQAATATQTVLVTIEDTETP
jgi:hypothetical protein